MSLSTAAKQKIDTEKMLIDARNQVRNLEWQDDRYANNLARELYQIFEEPYGDYVFDDDDDEGKYFLYAMTAFAIEVNRNEKLVRIFLNELKKAGFSINGIGSTIGFYLDDYNISLTFTDYGDVLFAETLVEIDGPGLHGETYEFEGHFPDIMRNIKNIHAKVNNLLIGDKQG